jgi:hypothetical protein
MVIAKTLRHTPAQTALRRTHRVPRQQREAQWRFLEAIQDRQSRIGSGPVIRSPVRSRIEGTIPRAFKTDLNN